MNVTVSPRRLQGWKEIAAYLKTSPRTAQRWEEYLQLPVRRETRIRGATVYALPDELNAWRVSHSKEIEEDIGATDGAEPSAYETAALAPLSQVRGAARRRHHRAVWSVFGAAAVVLGLFVLVWFLTPGIRNRQTTQPPATPSSEQFRPAAYAARSGGIVLVMRIRVGSESATIETATGAMVTVTLPSRRKLALVLTAGERGVDLLLADVLPRDGRLEAVRELSRQQLPPSGPVVLEAGEGLSVEILRSATTAATGPSEAPKTCCVSCGSLTVCAGRVETSCGKCDAAK